jgi:ABC-type phosphate/phosphonate transport system substrate-binding protein
MNFRAACWRAELTEGLASLPMYDFPDLREAHDALWRSIAARLQALEMVHAPPALLREEAGEAALGDPRLLLSQTCGYPLALGLRPGVRVVTTPGYRARGCQGPFHRSVVLVRMNDKAMNLSDLRGRRLAFNAPDSNTGVNLLRAEIAPMALSRPFFGAVIETGAHVRSVAAVAEGVADVAAVDCVTWALLERSSPALCGRLRVLAWTMAGLGLPLVTGPETSLAEIELLRQAIEAAVADRALADVRRTLLLHAVYRTSEVEYRGLLRLKSMAAEQGYPELV